MGCTSSIPIKQVSMRDLILQYISIEQQVRFMERGRITEVLKHKKEQHEDANQNIRQLSGYRQTCIERRDKEYNDVQMAGFQTVKNFFEEGQSLVEKEQKEYLDACSDLEAVEQELRHMNAETPLLWQEIQELEHSVAHLESMYIEQDNILVAIFHGAYGSQVENLTECQLDAVVSRRTVIEQAQYRWANASILVQYVNQQLDVAISLWKQIVSPDKCDMQWRYLVATRTRDNLLSAYTNLQTAHSQIGNGVKFPYCTEEQIAGLMLSIRNIYSDMQSVQSHTNAMAVYWSTRQSGAALFQWLQHVIENSIKPDLANILQAVKVKKKELRTERLKLLKLKMIEHGITDIQLLDDEQPVAEQPLDKEINSMKDDSNNNYNFNKTPMILSLRRHATNDIDESKPKEERKKLLVQKMRDISGLKNSYGSEEDFQQLVMAVMCKEARVRKPEITQQDTLDIEVSEPEVPEELATVNLAPIPKQRDIFGDIEDLKRKHEHELEELMKVQDESKLKQEQNLKNKLQTRRNHKARAALQNLEVK